MLKSLLSRLNGLFASLQYPTVESVTAALTHQAGVLRAIEARESQRAEALLAQSDKIDADALKCKQNATKAARVAKSFETLIGSK